MPQITITYAIAGTFTWVAPSDVTSVQVELWGGGGTGGPATGTASGAGGGAGGQYAVKQVAVSASTSHTVVVAALATAQISAVIAGNDSTFDSTTVVAKGGAGGANATATTSSGGAGSTASGVGDTVRAGGSGGNGVSSTVSGGGGGGAGSTATGNSGSGQTAGTATSNNGGAGGTGVSVANTNNPGSNYGGGGSGGLSNSATDRAGGNGAQGLAKLTFTTNNVALTSVGGNLTTAVSSQTHSVVIDNNNSTLIVGVQAYDGTTPASTLISSVKFNGVDLTQLRAVPENTNPTQFNHSTTYLYAITGLAAQTANLVVTWAAVCSNPQSTYAVYANTAGVIDNSSAATTLAASAFTGNVTTIANNALCWSFIVFNNNSSSAPSGADQQQTFMITTGFDAASSSKTAKSPAGSVTHTYTNGAPDDYIIVMGSIAPAPLGRKVIAGQAINRAGTY